MSDTTTAPITTKPPQFDAPSESTVPTRLLVDYSNQFKLARLIEHGRDIIINTLRAIADECLASDSRIGILIAFGAFDNSKGKVYNVVQMGSNPITSHRTIYDKDFKEFLYQLSKVDGAVIVNRSGQIIGAKTYLVISDPDSQQDDECGTRHRAAASFSKRDDVNYVFTLSEETLRVRQWSRGQVEEMYEPAQENGAVIAASPSQEDTSKKIRKSKKTTKIDTTAGTDTPT